MMKFGLLTAILDGWSFEEVVDIASQMGFYSGTAVAVNLDMRRFHGPVAV